MIRLVLAQVAVAAVLLFTAFVLLDLAGRGQSFAPGSSLGRDSLPASSGAGGDWPAGGPLLLDMGARRHLSSPVLDRGETVAADHGAVMRHPGAALTHEARA